MKPLAIILAFAMYAAATADDAPQPTPADEAVACAEDAQTCQACRTPLRTVLRAPVRAVAAPVRLLVKVHRNRVAVRQCRRAMRQARRCH